MGKIRYEVDPQNRLVVSGPGRSRTVLDGDFRVSGRNRLSYHVKKSDNIRIPQEIKFSGKWSLGQGQNLTFMLDKWNNQCEGEKLVLKSGLLSAKSDELAFLLETKNSSLKRRVYILKLDGKWQADRYNRLSFNVETNSGSADKLVFLGAWSINKKNEIVYRRTKKSLKTKEKTDDTIILRGHWDITSKDRLSYTLEGDPSVRLDFKVSFQKALKDSLRYGISVGRSAAKTTITVFGKWSLKKGLGLTFEVSSSGAGPCIKAELAKKFLNGAGEGYIKTLVSRQEASILGGLGVRW